MVASHETSFLLGRKKKKQHLGGGGAHALGRAGVGFHNLISSFQFRPGSFKKVAKTVYGVAHEPRFLFRPELFWNSISSVRACLLVLHSAFRHIFEKRENFFPFTIVKASGTNGWKTRDSAFFPHCPYFVFFGRSWVGVETIGWGGIPVFLAYAVDSLD